MKKKTLARLWSYIKSHKGIFAKLVFSAVSANALSLLMPYLSGRAIDFAKGYGNVNFKGVFFYVAVLGCVYVASAFFSWVSTVFTTILSNRVIEKMRKDAFDKISILPLRFFDERPHGDIMSRLTNDIDSVSEGLLQGTTQMFSGLMTVIGSLAIMFWLNYHITFAILVITAICVLVSKFIAARSSIMFRKQFQTIGEMNAYIEEMIGNQKVVKAFGYEKRAQKSFEEINKRLYECGQKAQFYSSLVNPTTRYINNLAYICVGVLGGLFAVFGNLSIGIVSSFLIYATQFARPINDMTGILTQLQSAVASAERIFEIIDEEPEKDESVLLPLKADKGEVVFENVSFSYNKDTELIKNLNIRAKAGDTVAIVGPTGAGKTTIVNLLMRFYEPNEGKIFVDGTPVDEASRDSVRQTFAMVLQESWLFSGTIRENIAYAKIEAGDEEIIEAAKSAYAHGFIKKLPKGYDTIIAEDGENLSQGQKQLITIARAMLADHKVLILDEATSSVDTMTEQRIQKAFLKMMSGRTSFVIAHRLSTIKEADLILVMNDGKIVEQGSHMELIKKDGFYAKLYNN
ncbi:MAG: ABC transporter ATP-binding protein/permease [Clostridia bacterium]|nr:ABC transporter ATP-binding protein/permease [Clostridia bacterium]